MKQVGKDYGWGKPTVIGDTNGACCRCGVPMPAGNGIVNATCPTCQVLGVSTEGVEAMIRKVLLGEEALVVVEEVLGGRDGQGRFQGL